VAVGINAGYSLSTGVTAWNTIVGATAGYSVTTGVGNTLIGGNSTRQSGAGYYITTGSNNTVLGGYDGNQGGLDIRTASNYIVLSDGDGNPRGIFDGSGNFFIGTTSIISGVTAKLALYSADLAGTANTCAMKNGANTTGGAYIRFANYLDATIGSITQNTSTSVLYNVTSDQRLKENIVDAPEFGSVIDAIQVRSYDWKADGNHQRAGFIAQELVTVAPEAVHQPADAEEMMAVDYSKLVPMLVKEIQSLRKRLADAGIA
jgi:hypothetical protein